MVESVAMEKDEAVACAKYAWELDPDELVRCAQVNKDVLNGQIETRVQIRDRQ